MAEANSTNIVLVEQEAKNPASNQNGCIQDPQASGKEPTQINRMKGHFISHGKAPYNNDSKNTDSYFVTLENADGEHATFWGVGLECALTEVEAEPGQELELVNRGRQAVTIKLPIKNEKREVIDYKTIQTHRDTWGVKAGAAKVEMVREKDLQADKVIEEHPDLVNEIAALKKC